MSGTGIAPSEDQMGNGVAYWAVKTNAIIKSDCQVMLDPYISGVFMQCVTSERQYSETQRRHATGDLQKELSLRSHLNDQSATTHLNVVDAIGCAA